MTTLQPLGWWRSDHWSLWLISNPPEGTLVWRSNTNMQAVQFLLPARICFPFNPRDNSRPESDRFVEGWHRGWSRTQGVKKRITKQKSRLTLCIIIMEYPHILDLQQFVCLSLEYIGTYCWMRMCVPNFLLRAGVRGALPEVLQKSYTHVSHSCFLKAERFKHVPGIEHSTHTHTHTHTHRSQYTHTPTHTH